MFLDTARRRRKPLARRSTKGPEQVARLTAWSTSMLLCAIQIIPADCGATSRRKIISIRTMPATKRWPTRSTSRSSNSAARRHSTS